MSEEQFWGTDMTTVNQGKKMSWFKKLSTKRKLLYSMLLLFIVSWCFFIGFSMSAEMAEANAQEQYLIDGKALNSEEYAYSPVELTGLRTVLLVGYDVREGYEVGRSDTIMVAFLNMDTKSVKLLSIPRDTYVNIPGYGKTKINHAFSYGGITLVKETVEYLLGFEIDDYAMIDFNGFKELVDAVGGVELYVDMNMVNWNEGIEIYEGTRLLDGEKALGYVRYRGADCSDYDRIKHQQYFMRELVDKLLSFSSMTKVAELVGIFMNNVTTTIDTLDALQMAQYAFNLDLAGMEVYTIPGYSMYLQYGGYWLSHEIVNKTELINILNEIAGDGFDFSPNVIDDGGMGRYSIPEGEEEMSDDDMMSGDGSSNDQSGDGSGSGGDLGDGEGTNNGDGQGDVNAPNIDNPTIGNGDGNGVENDPVIDDGSGDGFEPDWGEDGSVDGQ